MKKFRNKPLKNWCFTGYKMDTDWKSIYEKNLEKIRYLIVQKESGLENNKSHWQGYTQLFNSTRLTGVKTLFGDDTLHLEGRKGTSYQAKKYCMKENTRIEKYIEFGKHTTQGKRTEIDDCIQMLTDGASWCDIIDEHPGTFVRYNKGLEKVKFILDKPKGMRKIQTKVYWGKSRTGKTYRVFDKHPDVYRVQYSKWFCGYEGQDTILLDDFYGQIPYSEMLHLLDGYRLMLQTKGGQCYAGWTKVYITSNKHPSEWYNTDDEALMNRFYKIYHFKKPCF